MTRVMVMYESGRVWSCEADAVGDGDAGEICAAACSIELADGALVFEPTVMPWAEGQWRSPTGVVSEWTNSAPGFVDCRGEAHDMKGGLAYSRRGTVAEGYRHKRYILLGPEQLEGAESVTVDGILAYCNEGSGLVPAIGGDADHDGGMAGEFATSNRPTVQETFAGMARTQQGIHYEPEVFQV